MSVAVPAPVTVVDQLRRRLLYAERHHVFRDVVSTGFVSVDRLLPLGGLPTGSLLEWIGDGPGVRTASLALSCISGLMKEPGALVVVDAENEFCASAVEALGIPLSRLLVVQPRHAQAMISSAASQPFLKCSGIGTLAAETLWALEQAARCAGVRVVLAWIDRLSSTAQRRLQLAVESSGTTVVLIRPIQALAQASWADLQFHVQSVNCLRLAESAGSLSSAGARMLPVPLSRTRLRVRLLRSRNAVQHEGCVWLEFHHETGIVSETAELARSATAT